MKWTEQDEINLLYCKEIVGKADWNHISSLMNKFYNKQISSNACRNKYNSIKNREVKMVSKDTEMVVLNNTSFVQEKLPINELDLINSRLNKLELLISSLKDEFHYLSITVTRLENDHGWMSSVC